MPIPLLIAAGISLLEQLIPYIEKLRASGRQSGELTPEQDAEFDARIKAVTSQRHWVPGLPPEDRTLPLT